MPAEVRADAHLALLQQVVVDRGDGVDDECAELVLLGQQRLHFRDDVMHIGRLVDDGVAGGDKLVIVLRPALAVDDVGIRELDGGGGFTDARRAEHEQLQPLLNRFGFTCSQCHNLATTLGIC